MKRYKMLILTTKSDDVDYDEVYEDGDYFYDEYEDDYDHYDDGFVGCVEDLEFVGWDDIIEYGLCSEGRHDCERCNRALSGSKPPAGDDQWAKHSGENVGWRFDSDTRWAKGKLQDRWNPIREDKESAAPSARTSAVHVGETYR